MADHDDGDDEGEDDEGGEDSDGDHGACVHLARVFPVEGPTSLHVPGGSAVVNNRRILRNIVS